MARNELDEFEDDSDFTGNDLEARRLTELGIAFTNAEHPMSSTEVYEKYYPGKSLAAFRKAFNRDRKKLAICGLVITRTNKQPDEPLWIADEGSFSQPNALSQRDVIILDTMCSQLASDPNFPYANDLRLALAKVDTSFDGLSVARIPAQSKERSTYLARIVAAFTSHHAVDIKYRKAAGEEVARRVAVYGFFSLRGHTYYVGQTLNDTAQPVPDSIRTYRLDRTLAVAEQPKITYSIPEDFAVEDYKRLPFQIGSTTCVATLAAYNPISPDLYAVIHQYGYHIDTTPDGITWECDVSSIHAAAAWCITYGIRPVAPSELANEWRSILEAVDQYGQE